MKCQKVASLAISAGYAFQTNTLPPKEKILPNEIKAKSLINCIKIAVPIPAKVTK